MPAKPTESEAAVLRELITRKQAVDATSTDLDLAESRGLKVVKNLGGHVEIDDYQLKADALTRYVFPSEIEELEAKLAAMKEQAIKEGTAVADGQQQHLTIIPKAQ